MVLGEFIIDEYIFCKAIGKQKEPYMVSEEKKIRTISGWSSVYSSKFVCINRKGTFLSVLGKNDNFITKVKKELNKNIFKTLLERKIHPQY